MRHRDITVRMAKNDDGPAVALLMEKLDFFQFDDWAIDWCDLEPNWLVAEHDGTVLGCIQVVPAKPIGRIEVLAVDPSLGLKNRYHVVRMLTEHAVAVIGMYGAQGVSSMIPRRYETYLKGAKGTGWVEIDDGAMVMKRIV